MIRGERDRCYCYNFILLFYKFFLFIRLLLSFGCCCCYIGDSESFTSFDIDIFITQNRIQTVDARLIIATQPGACSKADEANNDTFFGATSHGSHLLWHFFFGCENFGRVQNEKFLLWNSKPTANMKNEKNEGKIHRWVDEENERRTHAGENNTLRQNRTVCCPRTKEMELKAPKNPAKLIKNLTLCLQSPPEAICGFYDVRRSMCFYSDNENKWCS